MDILLMLLFRVYRIMVMDPADPDKGHISQCILSDSVFKLTKFNGYIYGGLLDGSLAIFAENYNSSSNLQPELILKLGNERIASVFGCREHIYAACGNAVIIIDAKTHTIEVRNIIAELINK